MSTTAPATPTSTTAGPADQLTTVDVGGAGREPGRTTVANVVVQKIAARAAREISGFHDFGGGAGRTFGAIAERIPGGRASAGPWISTRSSRRASGPS